MFIYFLYIFSSSIGEIAFFETFDSIINNIARIKNFSSSSSKDILKYVYSSTLLKYDYVDKDNFIVIIDNYRKMTSSAASIEIIDEIKSHLSTLSNDLFIYLYGEEMEIRKYNLCFSIFIFKKDNFKNFTPKYLSLKSDVEDIRDAVINYKHTTKSLLRGIICEYLIRSISKLRRNVNFYTLNDLTDDDTEENNVLKNTLINSRLEIVLSKIFKNGTPLFSYANGRTLICDYFETIIKYMKGSKHDEDKENTRRFMEGFQSYIKKINKNEKKYCELLKILGYIEIYSDLEFSFSSLMLLIKTDIINNLDNIYWDSTQQNDPYVLIVKFLIGKH